MENEIWSFHNKIAIPLEMKAFKLLGFSGRPSGTIFDVDFIEGGTFVEVMLYLLRTKHGFENDLSAFIKECAPYLGKYGTEIPKDKAIFLYDMFLNEFKNVGL